MKTGLRSFEPRMFEFDSRAIGIFRIALGLILLADQFVRLTDWYAFHGPDSLMAREPDHRWEGTWMWSVYWIAENRALPYVLEGIRFLAAIGLTLGVRSRLMAFIAFVIVSSVANYNPLLLQGGDRVLVVMLFFAIFLPLGSRYALEAMWHGPTKARTFRSVGTAAYAIQVTLVFFMAGILKTSPAWTTDYTAISMAVHLEDFATEIARLWRHLDEVTRGLTFFVIWVEWLAPVIALGPGIWARTIGVGALIMLEIGIWLSLEVGLFPLISVISLIPLVPGKWLDLVLDRGRARGREWVLLYDRNCRFCLFACRLLTAVCGWSAAQIRPAQDDAQAAEILREHDAWSLRKADEDRYTHGWAAVRRMLEESRARWIALVLPSGARGTKWYRWIGDRRQAFGSMGSAAFGDRRSPTPGRGGEMVALAAIASVVAWNVATYPAVRDRADYRPQVDAVVGTFNLRQYWNMFAPAPYSRDWWAIGIGLDREGNIRNLFTGDPLPDSIEPPRDGPAHYGGYRWRKTIKRSSLRNEMERVLRYWCRTGEWQAMTLWTVWRKNHGTSQTAKTPYSRGKTWTWRCEDTDIEQVRKFKNEVARRMAMGVKIKDGASPP